MGSISESGGDLPAVESFVKSVDGLDWPIGYGAGPTFDLLSIRFLPTLVVFDTRRVAVWSGKDLNAMLAAVDQALAAR